MGAIDDLPPLREVIRQHALSARKSLGQNFLLDEQLLARIAAIPGDLADKAVLEVGPGPGGLTRALLRAAFPTAILALHDVAVARAFATIRSIESSPGTSANATWVVIGTTRSDGPASIITAFSRATPNRSATNSVWPG